MDRGWVLRGLALMIVMVLACSGALSEAPDVEPVFAEAMDAVEELDEIDLYDPSIYAEDVPEGFIIEEETPVPEVVETPEETEIPDATEMPEETVIPEPTENPEPTETPESTETPMPSASPVPMPEATILAQPEPVAAKTVQNPTAMAFPKTAVKLGKGEKLSWAARTPDGTAVTGVSYVSSKPSVVAVDAEGNLHARKKGSAKITATAANGVTCACKVSVLKAPARVKLSGKALTLCVGETGRLKAKLPAKSASVLTWTSSDPNVATVDASGSVKGVAAGKAVVTARTFNGKQAKCAVTVLDGRTPRTLSLSSKTVCMGVRQKLQLKPILGQGEAALFSYSSSKKKVATVSKGGVVTAKKKGTAKITVRTHNGLKVKLTVKVVKAPSRVTLSSASLSMAVGQTSTLKASLPAGTSSDITWRSSDETVASVDARGNVLALNPGTARITATTFNGKSAACDVTVSASAAPTVSSTNPTNAQMAANLRNDKSLGSKRVAIASVAELLMNAGFEPAFAAGVCANVYSEGSYGTLESSKYVANYLKRPRYFCYLDGGDYYTLKNGKYVLTAVYLSPEEMKKYTGPAEARQRFGEEKYYWNNWSGKKVWNVDLNALQAFVDKLTEGKWQGKFGMGITQWTGGRTRKLMTLYHKHAGTGSGTITEAQVIAAENEMILSDLRGDYKKVYDGWKKENKSNLNSAAAAKSAGSWVCLKYEIPASKEQKAVTRGERAATFYKIMTGTK